jgi:CheY-like chemotaxis protein
MTGESGQTKSCIRVLHLEDDPIDAELIETALKEHNIPCSITRAYTQEMFEAAFQKGDFDLILSDSQLPSFDTLSALTRAHGRYPDVPFIFVSGTASPNIKGEAFRHGASEFISKDDLPKLARAVSSLFFRRKHQISPLPEMGMPVMVQCREFRCVGYLDRGGKWRGYGTSAELSDVVGWSEA